MDLQGDLEWLPGALGHVEEPAELVDFQTVPDSCVFDGPVGAAPTGHGRESIQSGLGADGPFLEHDRRSGVLPGKVAGGNRAVGRADVFAKSEVEIVAVQPGSGLAGGVPELGEPGIV